jgi:hypothetical protein
LTAHSPAKKNSATCGKMTDKEILENETKRIQKIYKINVRVKEGQ